MRKLAIVLLPFLVAAWVLLGQDTAPAELREAYDRALQMQAAGDLAGAESLLAGAIAKARSLAQIEWLVKLLDSLASLRAAKADLNGAKALYLEELETRKAQNLGSTAPVVLNVALMSARLSDYAGALKEAGNASAAAQREGDLKTQANALNIQGQILRQLGRTAEAEVAFNEAVLRFNSVDPAAALRVRVNLADIYWRRSEYRKALLTAFSVLGPLESGNSPRDLAAAYDALGNTFKLLQQDDRALDYFSKALALREKLPDQINRAFSYNNVATALTSLGRASEARGYHWKALEIRRAARSQREIAQTLINLAVAENTMGSATEALEHYREAATICEKNGYQEDLATTTFNIAELLISSGQWAEAEEKLDRALVLRRASRNQLGVVRCLSDLALVREHLRNDASVERDYRAAMDAYEKVAAEVSDPEKLGSFQEASIGLYRNFACYLIQAGRAGDALEVVERGRAVGLSRLAAMNASGSLAAMPAADREPWRQAAVRYSRASNQLRVANDEAAHHPSAASGSSRDEAKAEYAEAGRALAEVRERIYAAGGAPAKPLPGLNAGVVRELARANPDTLFLEWLVVDANRTFLFSITSEGVRVFPLAVTEATLARMVAEWRQSMGSSPSRGVKLTPEPPVPATEARIARELFTLILGPVQSTLRRAGIRRLVAVRDGPLLDAPLSALIDERGSRLIESLAIRSEVSLARCAVRPAEVTGAGGILVVADPLNAGELRTVAQNDGVFAPLAYARQEGKEIAAPERTATLLSGGAAKEATVKAAMPLARVVHFATHAFLGGSLRSGLLLATEPLSSADDGVLEGREIAEIPMQARLVVLSACETLRGEFQPGEGLIGLTWAFQAAGVTTVTASLWPVDDAATAKFMVAFYHDLRQGMRTDDALRSAMVKMIHDRTWYRPYFWASFAAFGSAESVWTTK